VTDLRAILQKPDVFGLRVPPAFFQTVLNHVQTGIMAFLAAVQALVIFLAEVFVNVAHMLSFYFLVFDFPDRGGTQGESWRKSPSESQSRWI